MRDSSREERAPYKRKMGVSITPPATYWRSPCYKLRAAGRGSSRFDSSALTAKSRRNGAMRFDSSRRTTYCATSSSASKSSESFSWCVGHDDGGRGLATSVARNIGSGFPMLRTARKAQGDGKSVRTITRRNPRAVTFAAFRVKPLPFTDSAATSGCTLNRISQRSRRVEADVARGIGGGTHYPTLFRLTDSRAPDTVPPHASVRWAIGRLITCRISPGSVGLRQADSRQLQFDVWRGTDRQDLRDGMARRSVKVG